MKISIFENFDETFKASIDKKTIVTLFDSMNDKNQISSLIGKCNNAKEKQRVLSYISNVLTGNQMTAVKAGVFTYNDRIAYVAYQGYKAVVVAFVTEGRATWKSFTVNLDTSRNRPTDTATILVGNAVEYKEKVQHETDAKITNVYKELEAKIKELEDNAKKDSKKIAELEKRDGAFVKNLRGEKLSFEEEIIIAMTTVSEAATSEKETIAVSNESTVFSVTETAENLNDDLIVSIDQTNKENNMNVNMTIENYEQHEEYIQEIIKLNHENTTLKASRKSLLKDLFAEIEKTSKLELELKRIKYINELNGK